MSLLAAVGDGLEAHTWVSLDLETTGLDPESEDIIEVSAIKFRGQQVIDSYATLVNPGRSISPFIQSLTGISQSELEAAPVFAAIGGQLQSFLGPHTLIGHSLGFDLAFLQRKGLRPPGPVVDTFDLASILLPHLPGYSLSGVARSLGIEHDRPHRAVADAQMSMAVFLRLLEELKDLDPEVLAEARRIADRSDWSLRHLLRELPTPEAPPLQAGEAGLEGVDLQALVGRLKSEQPISRKGQSSPIDAQTVRSILMPGGSLAQTLGAFEPRAEQLRMAQAVAEAFNDGQHLIVEAGTGTGKSLAYLLPAALFALLNGERTVVSTNTINLQEQLIEKDIPETMAALKAIDEMPQETFQYASLKGRGNYLCLRRWAALKRSDTLTAAEARTLVKLLLWLQKTATGDRSELNLTPPEAAVWSRLSAQGFDGQGPCPLARRGLCFYEAARSRADAAHIVVVNHALLTLDAKHGGLLPDYRRLIVDEAHNLEEAATNQLGVRIGEGDLGETLDRIVGGTPTSGAGLLMPFQALLRTGRLAEGRRRDLAAMLEGLGDDLQQARAHIARVFKLLEEFALANADDRSDFEVRLRLTRGLRAQPAWSAVEAAWEEANVLAEKVGRGLGRLFSAGEHLGDATPADREGHLIEVGAVAQRWEELNRALASAVASPDDSEVYWATIQTQSGEVHLHSAPLHVGPILRERLFSGKETAVLTGATLSTEGNYEYIKERLSLEPSVEVVLGSPFDYPSLVLLYIPQDMPEPNHPTYQSALQQVIAEVARAAQGRTMVLFTARAALRNARAGLLKALAGEDIAVLGQGIDGPPRQLLEAFKAAPRAVLLGTGSFWEGVDIAGEALSVLVIARLPFGVPSEPVFAARSQQFDDPFSHYAVPQAALRFKQGFGRLIRRRTDRGVLVVLDRRVLSKPYGAAFLDSIPKCTRKIAPARDLPQETVRWLSQRPLTGTSSGT